MPHATVHRISPPRSALAALLILTVSAALVLGGAPAHGLPTASDSSVVFKATVDIVIDEDDTFTMKAVMTDNIRSGFLSESNCDGDSFYGSSLGGKATATFKDDGGSQTCTIEGSDSIDNSNGKITHKGDEYIVKTRGSSDASSSSVGAKYSQTVTFPGKVTEADGGKVEGNKVTFDDLDSHEVKGKDKAPKKTASQDSEGESGSTPMWVWALVGVLAMAIVGGIVAAVVMNQRKKNHSQLVPYAAPAQGYDPNQTLFSQPVQQPYQPGYAEPAIQPYQQPHNNQLGQPGQPMPQPYQPGYAEPATQPYQQPYNNQLGQPGQPMPQPYQPGYAEPATQPYQQPHNNQLGWPGQGV